MALKFNELPDFIIETTLSNLEFNDQLELQYCNKQFSNILPTQIYERLDYYDLYEYDRYKKFRSWIPKFVKYVKQLNFYISVNLHKVKNYFSSLEGIRVIREKGYPKKSNSLQAFNFKLVGFGCILYEPLPTELDFINLIENVNKLELHISFREDAFKSLALFSKLQLTELNFSLPCANSRILVDICSNFPKLKILSINYWNYDSDVDIVPGCFINLIKLVIKFNSISFIRRFPFQSFPKLKALEFNIEQWSTNDNYRFVVDSKLDTLINVKLVIPSIMVEDILIFQQLKYADLYLQKSFNNHSMIRLFSLPSLLQLILRGNLLDSLFKDVKCKGKLYKLELEGRINLSHNFFSLLQHNMSYLVNLTLRNTCKFNKACDSSVFQNNSTKRGTKLQFISVSDREIEFINWVKWQSEDTIIIFNNTILCANPGIKYRNSL